MVTKLLKYECILPKPYQLVSYTHKTCETAMEWTHTAERITSHIQIDKISLE